MSLCCAPDGGLASLDPNYERGRACASRPGRPAGEGNRGGQRTGEQVVNDARLKVVNIALTSNHDVRKRWPTSKPRAPPV